MYQNEWQTDRRASALGDADMSSTARTQWTAPGPDDQVHAEPAIQFGM